MNGNHYEMRFGMVKGRCPGCEKGSMKDDKARILVVEDDLPLALLMVHVLTRVGFDVEMATTGKKALEKAVVIKFDLITLNVVLPDTNGFELCSELKQRHISHKTPILFISASPCQQDIDEAKRRGAVDYLTKPFDTTELIYRVVSYAKANPIRKETGV